MTKRLGIIKVVIIVIVCFSGGLLIGKYWGYLKLAREVQLEISKYQLREKANSRNLVSLKKERDRLQRECADLKKERDIAIRQRDVVVRAFSAVFNESSHRSSHRK